MKIRLKIDLVEDTPPHRIIENIVNVKSVSLTGWIKEMIIAFAKLIKKKLGL